MTVLERLKAAGYDPAVSLFPDSIGNAGSMECERIQIRTFFCRPRENEAAIGVTATAMTHFSDGSTRPYPDGWPRSLEASVTLYFAGDAKFHYFGNVATDLVGSDAEFRYEMQGFLFGGLASGAKWNGKTAPEPGDGYGRSVRAYHGSTLAPVCQIDRKTNQVIHEYPSIAAASRATGLDDSAIGKVCKGKLPHAGGFLFRYIEQ